MNISDSMGESSSKRQENGDAPTGSDRPLKKARFAWQVKGKYHLKNDNNDATQPSTSLSSEPEAAGPSSQAETSSGDLAGSAEQNLEILGDYLLKQDFNTLDSVIADSEKSMLKPSTSISSTANLDYPKYASCCHSFSRTSGITNKEHGFIHMSMVHTYSEDQCIARWQAKQMAKGFVDNTINRVLESWCKPPLVPNMDDSRFLALDIAEFINNLPDDNTVENEGILMAISEHGLQNTSTSSANASEPSKENNENEDRNMTPAVEEDITPSPPSSPTPSEELGPFVRKPTASWSFPEEEDKEENDLTQFSVYNSSSPCEYLNENDHSSPVNNYSDSNFSVDHFALMDAAVSLAILNKGLTTFGNDYG